MLYCFLDTNIFIHCQDIKDIDWKSEFGESEVCLVIAPVVFEELDSFKDDPRNSRKRDRARRANKLLETILDSPARLVKDDVHLDESEGLDGYEFGVYNLSPANNDDRLVASMIAWSHEYRDDELILVSHDSGPRRKARRAGLTAKQLSDKYQLPDQLDPRDKKIRELKSKLAKIEDAQPNLHLGFQSKTGSIEHFSLAAVDLSAEYIAEDEVRSFVEGKRSEIMRNSDIDERHFAFFDKFGRDMTRTDIPEFGDHVERWLSFEYAPFLRARSIKEVFHSRAAKVALTLQNIGFGTADGLNISLLIRGSWKLELESPDDPQVSRRATSTVRMENDSRCLLLRSTVRLFCK